MKNALRSQSICILRIPKSKFEKKNTPTHSPSLPQMVCTLAQIYPNCAIHWLEKVTKKIAVSNTIWCFDFSQHDLV
jgi:hypothetical protein